MTSLICIDSYLSFHLFIIQGFNMFVHPCRSICLVSQIPPAYPFSLCPSIFPCVFLFDHNTLLIHPSIICQYIYVSAKNVCLSLVNANRDRQTDSVWERGLASGPLPNTFYDISLVLSLFTLNKYYIPDKMT
jgi:hypothetical protein